MPLGNNLPLTYIFKNDAINNIQIPVFGPLGDAHIDTLALSWVCMGGILATSFVLTRNLKVEGGGPGQALLEGLYKLTHDVAKGQIGHKFKPFFPLIAGIFVFVLTANFIGVGPWKIFEHMAGWPAIHHNEPLEIASPTTDFNVTAGLALISLLVYLGSGFWAHGPAYLKLYVNPIEWLDLIVRPSTLALRLMVVITADELMRAAFLSLVPFLLPSAIMGFELFIGVIQAFVFSLLTSIYIGLTVAEHH